MNKRAYIPTPLSRPDASSASGPSRKRLLIAPLQPNSRLRSLRTLLSFLGAVLLPFFGSLLPGIGPRRFSPAVRARRLREHLERAGGIWVKVGQVLAMRRDLLPMVFCEELANLHDHARGFPGEVSLAIIERELGRPIADVFSYLDPTPLAAASIGQVHRGRLRDGDIDVAVKVQRPMIVEQFKSDLRYVHLMAGFLKRAVPHGHWDDMLWELERTLLDELDYRIEAGQIHRMRRRITRHKNIYAPQVFLEHCTPRMLVMEFVQGVFMSEYLYMQQHDPQRVEEWLHENDIKPPVVARRLLFTFLRQILEDNLFHCDLHPGNILLQRKNQIVLIDFGSVGSFERSFLERFRMNFAAIAAKDFNKIADLLLIEMPGLPIQDVNEAKQQIIQAYRAWTERVERKNLPYNQRSLAGSLNDIGQVYNRFHLPPAWEYLRYQRGVFTLDASFRGLSPQMNIIREMRGYLKEAQQRSETPKKSLSPDPPRPPLSVLIENTYFEGEWMRRRLMRPPKTARLEKLLPMFRVLSRSLLRIVLYAAIVLAVSYMHQGPSGLAAMYARTLWQRVDAVSAGNARELIMALLLASAWLGLRTLRNRQRKAALLARSEILRPPLMTPLAALHATQRTGSIQPVMPMPSLARASDAPASPKRV